MQNMNILVDCYRELEIYFDNGNNLDKVAEHICNIAEPEFLNKIEDFFRNKIKNDKNNASKIKTLQKAILDKINSTSARKFVNWKDALLRSHYQRLTRSYMTQVNPDIDANYP